MDCFKASAVRKLDWEVFQIVRYKVPLDSLLMRPRSLPFLHHASTDYPELCKPASVTIRPLSRHSSLRAFAVPVSLLEEASSLSPGDHLSNTSEVAPKDAASSPGDHLSNTSEVAPKDAAEELLPRQSDELKSMLADSERRKLLRKLSEANQYNRYLRRQVQLTEDALVDFKSELAVLELELQALVGLAEEVTNSSTQLGSRKVNGKYISSHLLSRLEAVHGKVKEHIKDIDYQKVEEITLFWVGMAESVQVMGSFDGWSQGEEMSSEYTGSCTSFSTTLKLRRGRYEIKFLVDGEWRLSPELPTVGEGLLKNNLLVVE